MRFIKTLSKNSKIQKNLGKCLSEKNPSLGKKIAKKGGLFCM